MNKKLFENKYGSKGGMKQLTKMRSSLSTQKAISLQFGVSRERVRQWMLEFFSDTYDPREKRREIIIESMMYFAKLNSKRDFYLTFRSHQHYKETLERCYKQKIYDKN